MLGKNLAHTLVLPFETALVWVGISLILEPPQAAIVLPTLAALIFALPLNMAAGNLLSLYFPRPLEFAAFRRQANSGVTVFASLGMQVAVIGVGAIVLLRAWRLGELWLATLLFLLLAAPATLFYRAVLNNSSQIALRRREALTAELSR
jgi:ABC-2 type transport system permease protein